ncbi:unnamed protein product [Dicrocoelium dendriticum]|nr:unnamed protein product [Dicrocoelium dendriticum]
MTTGTMAIESFRHYNFLTTEQHETHPSSPSCLSTTRSTLRRVVMLNRSAKVCSYFPLIVFDVSLACLPNHSPCLSFSSRFTLFSILTEDSSILAKKLLKLGAVSSLLYAMGNLEYPDSQRQASLALEFLCHAFPSVDQVVREAMGPSLYSDFICV